MEHVGKPVRRSIALLRSGDSVSRRRQRQRARRVPPCTPRRGVLVFKERRTSRARRGVLTILGETRGGHGAHAPRARTYRRRRRVGVRSVVVVVAVAVFARGAVLERNRWPRIVLSGFPRTSVRCPAGRVHGRPAGKFLYVVSFCHGKVCP